MSTPRYNNPVTSNKSELQINQIIESLPTNLKQEDAGIIIIHLDTPLYSWDFNEDLNADNEYPKIKFNPKTHVNNHYVIQANRRLIQILKMHLTGTYPVKHISYFINDKKINQRIGAVYLIGQSNTILSSDYQAAVTLYAPAFCSICTESNNTKSLIDDPKWSIGELFMRYFEGYRIDPVDLTIQR